MTVISLALRQATNVHGALGPQYLARVRRVLDDPSEENWDEAYTVILNAETWCTLWQAVLAVDPDFPRTGPAYDETGLTRGWLEIPDRDTLLRAINYAVTGGRP